MKSHSNTVFCYSFEIFHFLICLHLESIFILWPDRIPFSGDSPAWEMIDRGLEDHPISQIQTRRTDFDTLDIDMDNIVRADIWQNTMDNL